MNIDTRNNNTNFTSSIRLRYFLENGIEYKKSSSMPLVDAIKNNKTFQQKLGQFDREFQSFKQKIDLACADGYLFTGTTARNYNKSPDKAKFIKNATALNNTAIRMRNQINEAGEYSGDILELQVIINAQQGKINIVDMEAVKEGSNFFKRIPVLNPEQQNGLNEKLIPLKIPSWAKRQSAYALELGQSNSKHKSHYHKTIPGQQTLNFDTQI